MDTTREQALRFRYRQQQLDDVASDPAVLDLGVPDTGGPHAARWALTLRGAAPGAAELVHVWTLRGAPHAYRRREIAEVAAATAPFDEADAAKRVFDAAKPLRGADIPVLDALDTVAGHLRDLVREPTGKGEASAALTARLPAPYLRECRPCAATHTYEQPFRLAALRAGLELTPDTSPPVLRPIPGWTGPAAAVPDHLDVVRAALYLLGPTTPALVAGYLDAPVRAVRRRWPDDAVELRVDGEPRAVLAGDLEVLREAPSAHGVRLLGAFDPWLQARDRDLLVGSAPRRRELWPVLGRPGAVLVGHEVVGTWRPRSSGPRLRLFVALWDGGGPPEGIDEQAERLAAHRGQRFAGFVDA
jgi:hypothetical protein